MWRHELTAATAEQTQGFAAKLAGVIRKGDVLCLQGTLGSGKTTFSQGIIQALLPGEEVTSPTFNLVKTYPLPGFDLWHFDLYRLDRREQLWELGIEEALMEGALLIEWPEIAASLLPASRLTVKLEADAATEKRTIRLEAEGGLWNERLKGVL
ncbi:MAG: tRNA (adenosine(37)-N6)-threonylcarbamoyltransferase complex ATPase subunit type 1 TsaE [Alphaproteobacteria bacterium]|nr:tRNA (adenosine(37)-N6)-threonylcarbamoyltransferase complex ATPase subunit type 1 TsaE [Alphaproteobacteria bacterium]